jgi:alpha-beta hydrolase superfamily lysophospholipase
MKHLLFSLLLLNVLVAVLVAGCQAIMPTVVSANAGLPAPESAATAPPAAEPAAEPTATLVILPTATPTAAPAPAEPTAPAVAAAAAPVQAPAPVEPAAPIATTGVFTVGNELTIAALLQREIQGSPITIEQQLENGANYARYIASYISEGNKIYGLLTVPLGDPPEGGFKAIVFNHGYIPPSQYRTTERYVAYVDALARSGFVVFKIDLRGFGNSEGEPEGSYFSPAYTIDAISALKSLQTLDYVDPDGIGMWGHSMAGNLVLRAMLIEPAIKAGVIWAGAVYSYDDMTRYSIQDSSYVPPSTDSPGRRIGRQIRETYGQPNTAEPFWQAVSLTKHIDLLQAPLQLNHALNDPVVNVGYSDDLAAVLNAAGKAYEYHQYEGGGHNIDSPYFNEAIQRTIQFFQAHL